MIHPETLRAALYEDQPVAGQEIAFAGGASVPFAPAVVRRIGPHAVVTNAEPLLFRFPPGEVTARHVGVLDGRGTLLGSTQLAWPRRSFPGETVLIEAGAFEVRLPKGVVGP